MDYQSTVQWLFEHGGPVIRYRLAREYGDVLPQVDLEVLEADLLKASIVQFWLNNFKTFETLADQQKRGEGLGEDRRRSQWRTIESTFWMLLISRPPASTG